jgi:hypothetical protein
MLNKFKKKLKFFFTVYLIFYLLFEVFMVDHIKPLINTAEKAQTKVAKKCEGKLKIKNNICYVFKDTKFVLANGFTSNDALLTVQEMRIRLSNLGQNTDGNKSKLIWRKCIYNRVHNCEPEAKKQKRKNVVHNCEPKAKKQKSKNFAGLNTLATTTTTTIDVQPQKETVHAPILTTRKLQIYKPATTTNHESKTTLSHESETTETQYNIRVTDTETKMSFRMPLPDWHIFDEDALQDEFQDANQDVFQDEKVEDVYQDEKVEDVFQDEKVEDVFQDNKLEDANQDEKLDDANQDEKLEDANQDELQDANQDSDNFVASLLR